MRLSSCLIFSAFALLALIPAPALAEPCPPVATLFGQPFCEIFEENGGTEQDISEKEAMLEQALWTKGLEQRFGVDAFQPTEEEIKNFTLWQREGQERQYKDDSESAALLRAAHENTSLNDDQKAQIADVLKTIETSQKLYEQRKTHDDALNENYGFIADDSQKQVVADMVTTWKIDRALFQTFGGTLIVRNGQIIPFDARNQFREWIKTEGRLEISNTAYETVLDADAAQPNDKVLLPEDSTYANYYTDASWRFTHGEGSHTAIIKDWLEKLKKPAPKQ